MRGHGVVLCFCNLVSLALLVIVLNQHHVLILMKKENERQPKEMKSLDNQLSELKPLNDSVEKLLTQGEKLVKDLEAKVTILDPNTEKMRTAISACEGDMKAIADELTFLKRQRTETEALLKAESNDWTLKINNLKAQTMGYRPICDYVKDNTIAKKFCGTKGQPMTPRG